jgi:prepilin-type N-terminal cleavage/methylation domain-containing protein
LSDMRVRNGAVFQDNRTYVGGGTTCGAALPPDTTNFTFGCVGSATTYTATATGANSMAGFGYTITFPLRAQPPVLNLDGQIKAAWLGINKGWHMLVKSLSAGFTMIELMIGLVILAILLSLGMPAFTGILESSRTKAAASGFAMGLQRARAEAISRNTTVTFTPSGAGWTMSAAGAGFDVKDAGESSGGQVTVTPEYGSEF